VNKDSETKFAAEPEFSSQSLEWEGVSLGRFSLPPVESGTIEIPEVTLHLQSGASSRIEVHEAGRMADLTLGDAQLCVSPAGWRGRMLITDPSEFVQLRIQPDFFGKTIDENVRGRNVELVTRRAVIDPQLVRICQALEYEAQMGGESGRAFSDALATALAARLLAVYSVEPFLPYQYRGGLPRYALRLVIDYMQAHLDQDVRLSDLANLVHLSSYHFARLFRQSMGVAPHRYLLEQRVERAKALLADRTLTIAGVAAALGFQSQSHFTSVFRRIAGSTPKQYRNTR